MLRSFRLALIALTAASAVVACRDVEAPIEDPATTTFAPSLSINLAQMTKTSSGIYYRDLVVGTGKAAVADSAVKVYYTGWLSSGYSFESLQSGTAFSFALGTGTVIKGWDEGILAGEPMRVGGRRRLVIPPALGYGNRTSGAIPAGSILIFDITLLGAGA